MRAKSMRANHVAAIWLLSLLSSCGCTTIAITCMTEFPRSIWHFFDVLEAGVWLSLPALPVVGVCGSLVARRDAFDVILSVSAAASLLIALAVRGGLEAL